MKLRIPISIRFLIILTCILFAQGLAAVWVASERIKANIVEEKENEISIILSALHHSHSTLNRNGISLEADEILSLLNKDPNIEASYILNSENRIISALDSSHKKKKLVDLIDKHHISLINDYLKQSISNNQDIIWHDKNLELVHALSPIDSQPSENRNALPHAIYLRLNMLDTEQIAISRLIKALIPIGFICLLTALFSAWFFHRYINRRISSLQQSANTFTDQGNINLPDSTTNDELSDLHESLSRLMIEAQRKSLIEQEIRESRQKSEDLEQQLSMHWQKTPMGVIEWDQDFKVVAWNPAAEKVFGYTAKEALNQHASFIVEKETQKHIDVIWKELASKAESINSSNINITKDGRAIVCDWINTPLTNKDGEVIGAASFVQDKTAEHEALKSLVAREQEQSEILNSMNDAVISIDQDGIIHTFNQSAEKLFGYNAHELVNKHVNALLPDNMTHVYDSYMKAYSEGGDLAKSMGIGREVHAKHKSGEIIPVNLSVSELPKSNNRRRFIGCCQDLRNKKQQEQMLRRSQKMDALGKLTGGIAHDFNNILGVVTGYSELLLHKVKDQTTLRKYAEEIKAASVRGTKLTSKLLASSKKKQAVNELVNINDIMLTQKEMLTKTLPPNTKLIYQVQEDLWPVLLDSDDFQDAVLNLCLNAVQAIQDDGKLCLFTYNCSLKDKTALELNLPDGDYAVFCISDTGTGMDKETKERIFEPFFTTKGTKGTGLGLSQVFGFVERSDAAIKVDSTPGQGSQFSIYFPRALTNQPPIQKPIESEEEKGTNTEKGKESILVVDDEVALRELCIEILSGSGYHIECASDGEEALKILNTKSFDLLLSDIVMPNMNGYQLAEEAKRIQPALKVQLTSGYDPEQHQEYGDKTLRKSILAKPYTPFILLKQVRYVLDNE